MRQRAVGAIASVSSLTLAALLLTGVPAQAAPPSELSVTQPKPVDAVPVKPKYRPKDLSQGANAKRQPVKVTWPEAGTGQARMVDTSVEANLLRHDGETTPVVAAQAGDLPVWVGPAKNRTRGTSSDAVSQAQVQVLDRAKVPSAWRDGVVLRVGRNDGMTVGGRANVTIDYSGFADAYGADWSSRLRLVALPECALTTPAAEGCAARVLPSHNDSTLGRVSADVDLAASNAGSGVAPMTVVALTAGASGDGGDYGATPLQASSTWSAGGSSGDFTWSYPLAVPTHTGPAPSVKLAYSSSAVDGRSDASNNQTSWLGEGFDYHPGFVERRYLPCSSDKAGSATNDKDTGDQCWGTDNAVLSLNGRSSELIKDAATGKWRPKNEDASKIERLTGAANGDDNGEHWKVTTADGTQYFFGRDDLPGQTSATDSVNYVRVYGNHPGEPCYQSEFKDGHCNQAWRWNLDYVVDVHGNTMSMWYARDTNKYSANTTDSDDVTYVRASTPTRIDYGTWDRGTADRSVVPTGQVLFTTADRCLANCTTHNATTWPDTPWDQECTGDSCAGKYSPTFWTTKRLSRIATRVAGVTGDVHTWTLTHTFPPNGDATRDGMWLESIVHAANEGGTTLTLPEINFDWVQKANRVDTLGDTKPPMYWMRMGTIWTDTGGKVSIRYSGPDCDPATGRMPTAAHTNTLRCYPVLSEDPETKAIKTDYFHKYVVTEVDESDWTGGGDDAITKYEYLGTPAWRHTDDDGLTKDKLRTWSDYRGYGTVRVRQGDDGQETLAETVFYRGLHGDKEAPSGGTRVVRMDAVDLNGDGDTADAADAPQADDENAFAGQVRKQTMFNGVDTDVVSVNVNQVWQSDPTATRDMGTTTAYARYSAVNATWSATRLDHAPWWRVTRTDTAHDAYGMVDYATDHGDVAKPGDERCTDTSYARNTSLNMLQTVAREQEFALTCGEDVTHTDHVITDVRSSYDGNAYYVDGQQGGTAPTKGDVTQVETLKDWTSTGGTEWVVSSRSGYDAHGRVVEAWDIRGNKAATAYTPTVGGPVTKVTTTDPLGTTIQEFAPASGMPIKVTDINGKITEQRYDALGRLTKVWLANRPSGSNPDSPSIEHVYTIRNSGGVNAVTTRKINAAGSYTTSYTLFDGLLRPRQTQTPAASGGGTVFTETVYDKAGRVAYTSSNHHDADLTAGTGLVAIAAWQAKSQVVNEYDRAGRITASVITSGGVEKSRTTTAHGGDRVYVTPPLGGTPTTTITDVRGNTVELRQHDGGVSGPFDATVYTYNGKNQLVMVEDPAKNKWTYGYDMMGRQTSTGDPDKGSGSSTYNAYGDLLTTTDALTRTLAYEYDGLGRKIGLYDTSVDVANKRASWAYDPSGAKGQLASSSRWTTNGTVEYKTRIRGYNALYKSTGEDYIVPSAETGLNGTYTFTRGYAADGTSLATSAYPNAGGLGGEQLTFTYDSVTGLPEQVQTNWPSAGQYVTNTDFTAFGELAFVEYMQTAQNWLQRSYVYDDITRLVRKAATARQLSPQMLADVNYDYDDAGNIIKIADTPAGGTADVQCFDYDYALRLVEAWTSESSTCSATAPTAWSQVDGAAVPYWHSWTFDQVGTSVGNRQTETKHGATNTVSTYTYPAAKAVRPHAVTKVVTTGTGAGTKNYTWDAAGNTKCRPNPTAVNNTCPPGTGSQNLTWDTEGKLEKLTDGAVDNTYLYDANGARLISRDGTGKTLYLPGTEIRYTTSGGAKTATRYYTHAGSVCAMRVPGSGITWLAADQQGTQQLAVASGNQAVTQRRQTPYGTGRGNEPAWPSTKGFLGGTKDPTGLFHLGARQYDPTLGKFISVDPVLVADDPAQYNAYQYASNSPITKFDPTGTTSRDVMDLNSPFNKNEARCDEACYRATNPKILGATAKSKNDDHQARLKAANDAMAKCQNGGCYRPHTNTNVAAIDVSGEEIRQDCAFTTEECTGLKGFIGRFIDHIMRALEMMGMRPGLAAEAGSGAGLFSRTVNGLCSFSEDTPVLMADGSSKPIAEVEIGDEVLAADPETGKEGSRAVTALWVHDDELVDLEIDGESVTATEDHPFWNDSDRRWEGAAEVDPGDKLLTADGRRVSFGGVKPQTARAGTAYNITVADIHTYYVLVGTAAVLVHNTCGLVELGPAVKTAEALEKFAMGEAAEMEFVFDAAGRKFLAGDAKPLGFDGSPHEQLAKALGANEKTVLGGTFFREEGRLVFTENSGHYGHRWTEETRQQFQEFLSGYGVEFDYRPWG